MHAICSLEDAQVDGFEGDVAIDNTGDDDLDKGQFPYQDLQVPKLTVGNARPYETLATIGEADPSAGDVTPSPAYR